MTTAIAIILSLIFLFLSFIHFYWVIGGRKSGHAVFPTKDDTIKPKMPGAIPTLVVAFGLLSVSLFIMIKAEKLNFSIPLWLDKSGLWIVAAIFILRAIGEFNYVGFFKRTRHTKFAQNDTKYYSPLCLIIGILTLMLELFK